MRTSSNSSRHSIACALAAALALAACHRAALSSGHGPTRTADGAARLPDFPDASYWTTSGPGADLPLISAHRGRPELPHYPENVLESIQRLHVAGDFSAEVDVQRSADGVLFLFHDWDLARLTVHEGDPGARTWADLDTMRVRDPEGRLSPYTIPSLEEVLAFAKGRLLLSLDRKGSTTYRQLYRLVAEEDMLDQVSLILYDDEDLGAYRELPARCPMNVTADTVLTVRAMSAACGEWHAAEPCPVNLFLGVGAASDALLGAVERAGLRSILGTFGELDTDARDDGGATYLRLVGRGVSVIATDVPLLAARAVYAPADETADTSFGESPTAPPENRLPPK